MTQGMTLDALELKSFCVDNQSRLALLSIKLLYELSNRDDYEASYYNTIYAEAGPDSV